MIQAEQVLEKKVEGVDKKIPNARAGQKDWLQHKIGKQRYLVLLIWLPLLLSIPDITNLAIRTALNTKLVEVESKIPDIINLATKAAQLSVQKPWRLRIKYLMQQVLLLPLILID